VVLSAHPDSCCTLAVLVFNWAWKSYNAGSARGRTLKVWDLETGREVLALVGHRGGVKDVAVSWNGRRAVSASRDDRTVKGWEVESGVVVAEFTCDRCCILLRSCGRWQARCRRCLGRVHLLALEE
jgi:WD40 repeat protein